MTIWFTADTHFGHRRVIELCRRPHRDIDEMDNMLISDWNKCVQNDDTIYHLGDFAYRNGRHVRSYFDRLPGEKHLIVGNHDKQDTLDLPWASISQIAEIVVEGRRVVLCHYPLLEWHQQRRGAIHLFGHVHGNRKGEPGSMDVGVDVCGFRPLAFAQVLGRLGIKP